MTANGAFEVAANPERSRLAAVHLHRLVTPGDHSLVYPATSNACQNTCGIVPERGGRHAWKAPAPAPRVQQVQRLAESGTECTLRRRRRPGSGNWRRPK